MCPNAIRSRKVFARRTRASTTITGTVTCRGQSGRISDTSARLPQEISMTSTALTRLFFGAITALVALPIVGSHPAMAQNHAAAALTGTVSSAQEGKMEGVVVSAKRPGSTIMVSVSTNAKGEYSFPQDRLAPGTYNITMRAVGYTLKPTAAIVQSGEATHLDLQLAKAAPDVLAFQMSNSEWMQSAPGTPTEKIELLRC